jgi:excisionase family DNA binding protein
VRLHPKLPVGNGGQLGDWVGEALSGLPPMVTTSEATTLLRTSRRNLYRLVARGRLHAVRAAEAGSSPLLIPRSSLERYLRSLEGR